MFFVLDVTHIENRSGWFEPFVSTYIVEAEEIHHLFAVANKTLIMGPIGENNVLYNPSCHACVSKSRRHKYTLRSTTAKITVQHGYFGYFETPECSHENITLPQQTPDPLCKRCGSTMARIGS